MYGDTCVEQEYGKDFDPAACLTPCTWGPKLGGYALPEKYGKNAYF